MSYSGESFTALETSKTRNMQKASFGV